MRIRPYVSRDEGDVLRMVRELFVDLVFVDEIWVAPERRGRGVGTALIEHGIATTKGAVAFELEVSPGNRARALYERLGFCPLRNASLRRMIKGAART